MAERIGIMTGRMFNLKLFESYPKPCIAQPKLEGERIRSLCHNQDLRSSGDKPRISLPHIQEEIKHLGWEEEIDGEAYNHSMRHSEIRSVVGRTVNIHPNHKVIEYHVYDLIDGHRQKVRLIKLKNQFRKAKTKYLRLVPSFPVHDINELQKLYSLFRQQGYEGIIIRHPHGKYERKQSKFIMKLKPRVSEYFEIISCNEEIDKKGNPKGSFGSFTLVTKGGKTFNAGTGPLKSQRKLFWEHQIYFIGKKVKIRFQGFTKANSVPKLYSIDKQWLRIKEKELKRR